MRKFLLLCIFAVTYAATAALASPNFTRIINGTPVSRNSIPVVELNVRDGGGAFLCSGTMVAPDVVLTARHCVVSRASNHTAIVKGKKYSASKVRIHPLSRNTSSGPIYDVALLFLRRNPKSNYLPIITRRKAQPGDAMYIYGYGITNRGSTGRLYSGAMVINRTDARWIIAHFDGEGSNTCEGDSGGPAFGLYKTASGKNALGLIGVTSGGERQDCQAGDVSYFVNLQTSATRSFLTKSVRSLATR